MAGPGGARWRFWFFEVNFPCPPTSTVKSRLATSRPLQVCNSNWAIIGVFLQTRFCICSAGIGRTGVLILMESGICLIEANQPIYPLDLVRTMRNQRAMLIQTTMQFRFVCEALNRVYKNHVVSPLPQYLPATSTQEAHKHSWNLLFMCHYLHPPFSSIPHLPQASTFFCINASGQFIFWMI